MNQHQTHTNDSGINKIDNQHFLSIYCMSGMVVSTLRVPTTSCLDNSIYGYLSYTHFTDVKTEVEKGETNCVRQSGLRAEYLIEANRINELMKLLFPQLYSIQVNNQ